MDLQLHGHWRPDEKVSGQQRPGRGEKARDARSWGRFSQAGLKNLRQELGAGAGGEVQELCTACLASLTPLFSLSLLSFSLSHLRKHLISTHNLALDLLSLSLARFSSSANSISLPNSE